MCIGTSGGAVSAAKQTEIAVGRRGSLRLSPRRVRRATVPLLRRRRLNSSEKRQDKRPRVRFNLKATEVIEYELQEPGAYTAQMNSFQGSFQLLSPASLSVVVLAVLVLALLVAIEVRLDASLPADAIDFKRALFLFLASASVFVVLVAGAALAHLSSDDLSPVSVSTQRCAIPPLIEQPKGALELQSCLRPQVDSWGRGLSGAAAASVATGGNLAAGRGTVSGSSRSAK